MGNPEVCSFVGFCSCLPKANVITVDSAKLLCIAC